MPLLYFYFFSFVVSEENHRDKRKFISLLQCVLSPRITILLFTDCKGRLDKQVDTDVYIDIVSAWFSCVLEVLMGI